VSGIVSFLAYENVTIIVWHATPEADAVERLRLISERRRKHYPMGVSAVHLVKGQFELPDGPTRDAFVRVVREGEGALAAVAVVISGSGFWASAVRSLLTGVRVVARGSFDMGLHTSLEECIKWLPAKHSARTGITLPLDRLERALRRADAFEQPVIEFN
jgi:hypothetical protein